MEEGHGPFEDGGKVWSDVATSQGQQEASEAERGKEESFLEHLEEYGSANTLVSDSWLPEP